MRPLPYMMEPSSVQPMIYESTSRSVHAQSSPIKHTVECYEVGTRYESGHAFRQVLFDFHKCGKPWSKHARVLSDARWVLERCIWLIPSRLSGRIRGRITMERLQGEVVVVRRKRECEASSH